MFCIFLGLGESDDVLFSFDNVKACNVLLAILMFACIFWGNRLLTYVVMRPFCDSSFCMIQSFIPLICA